MICSYFSTLVKDFLIYDVFCTKKTVRCLRRLKIIELFYNKYLRFFAVTCVVWFMVSRRVENILICRRGAAKF